jgi:cobalt-zinc-cadmium efflux system membrane fusion protein
MRDGMKTKSLEVALALICFLLLSIGGCSSAHGNPAAEAPPPVKVVPDVDVSLLTVEHPEQFALSTATARASVSKLVATGTVSPDILRSVPVISLASGRIVAIHAKLGDTVHKGQLLLQVQSSDVSGAFSDYRKAVNDERLARYQFDRAKILYDKGAISKSALETFEDAEQNAAVALETAHEHLRLLGLDKDHPTGIVRILAPASGVITDQQVANAAGVQALGSNPFTISDLSSVWIVCDVYENDLPKVRVGDPAEITLNAYPDKVIAGRINNIGAVLDPSIRTAKVRIEVRNPGMMRLGMFVTATFRGVKKEMRTEIPASAILHLHDREWVYVPAEDKKFRRLEVVGGGMLPNQMQEIVSGLQPGQQVVTNAVVLEHAAEQY